MPKVSVIIPTYNCGHYLEQAIESAMDQTYRDLEIIVLDDGSTDNTSEVVQKYGTKIRYIRQTNAGLPAARNRAIEASSGEFIALLDSDDWWEPSKLAEQVPLLEQDPEVALVYTDLRVIYDDGEILPSFLASRPLATSGYVFDLLLKSGFILPSTVLLRRTCLEEVGMFDESMRSHEDIELWLRICQRWKVALVDEPLTHRRQGATNMTSNDNLRTEYSVKLYEKALRLPNLTTEQKDTMNEKLAGAYFMRGWFYYSNGRMQECRRSLRQSLRGSKSNPKVWVCYAASLMPPTVVDFVGSGKKRLERALNRQS
jgi:glycosyltransferase involved in cell wall biosynthesis